MFARQSLTFLLIFSLAIPTWGAPKKPYPLLSVVFCQSLLTSMQTGDFSIPLTSLRELRGLLKPMRPKPHKKGFGYYTAHFHGDLKTKVPMGFKRTQFDALTDRLEQLEADTTAGLRDDFMQLGFELRGEEKIRNFYDRLNREIKELNDPVWAELIKLYPHWKADIRILDASVVLSILLFSSSAYSYPDLWIMGMAIFIFAFGISTIKLIHDLKKDYTGTTQAALDQSALIRRTLEEKSVTYPISIVSNYIQADVEFHRALMNTTKKPDLELTTAASEPAAYNMLDLKREEREAAAKNEGVNLEGRIQQAIDDQIQQVVENPEGKTRHVFYDSIFYRDPETHEPVWLIYYRAFKSNPLSKQKPPSPPKQSTTESSDKKWVPGLVPAGS